jgi:glycosyltransferase involved in cell wall biosynthesis
MKILIIANSSLVFGKELKNELEERSFDVTLLDFEFLTLFGKSGMDDHIAKSFQKFKNIPKLHMLFRMYYILQVIKRGHYDVVNIHYNRWFYKMLIPHFKSSKTKLVVSTYGSDFYRASDTTRERLRTIYEVADAVTFTNIVTQKEFVRYYNDFEQKVHLCRFGLKTLDYIDKNRDISKEEIRKKLGYAEDKVIVTCGYNATLAQQHFRIIEAIESLDDAHLQQCQFIFPLTYGDTSYRQRLIKRLERVAFNYKILETFLYEDENAYVKLASDIMINILQTDSFSGSMQEFLYAGNVVITGEWLPYHTFEEAGVFWLKVPDTDALEKTLSMAVEKLEILKKQTEKNRKVIASLSSWENTIENWRAVLQGEDI